MVSLVGGGGASMRPGELSLANHGVLFLDELAEFIAPVLDGLRQPLEEGVVRVSRARATRRVPGQGPARRGDEPVPVRRGRKPGACPCSEAMRHRYIRRVSGPLLDRFDLRVPVMRPSVDELMGPAVGRGVGHGRVSRRRRARGRPCSRRRDERRHRRGAARRRSRRSVAMGPRRCFGASSKRVGSPAAGCTECAGSPARSADLHGGDEVISDGHVAVALQLRVDPVAHDSALRVLNGQHDIACAVALATCR